MAGWCLVLGKRAIVVGRHGIGYLKANEVSFCEAKAQLKMQQAGFRCSEPT